ncbi:hypothetical protein [uncultured Thiodictyon sp.]|uniref:hypothetical protein n=1 Tax=uncultured Thiodictyon sp. TaxID=1846217 RepID=UPI0025D8E9EF|nr:hypothetical protein [uncultured Thiodictyon sp.]
MSPKNNWIYLWKRNQWEKKRTDIAFGEKHITYAASDFMSRRGLTSGDTLYVASINNGVLYLGGRVEISAILDRQSTALALGVRAETLWPANEYALGNLANPDHFRPGLVVDTAVLDRMWMDHYERGKSLPVRNSKGGVDGQTFRMIRRLMTGAEAGLERLLQ